MMLIKLHQIPFSKRLNYISFTPTEIQRERERERRKRERGGRRREKERERDGEREREREIFICILGLLLISSQKFKNFLFDIVFYFSVNNS